MTIKSFLGKLLGTESSPKKKGGALKGRTPTKGPAAAAGKGRKPAPKGGGVALKEKPPEKKDPMAEKGAAREKTPPKPPPAPDMKRGRIEAEILPEDEKVNDEGKDTLNVIANKVTRQEEMSMNISKGLKGLSSVLGDMNSKIEEQTKQSTQLVSTVKTIPEMLKDLPDSSRAGLELLNSISQIIDQQNKAVVDLNSKIANLPDVMGDLAGKVESDVRERRNDVSLLQKSLGDMRGSVQQFSKEQNQISKKHDENIKVITSQLNKVSYDQQNRVDSLMGRMKMMNRMVIFMIIVIIVGLVAMVIKLS